MEATFAHLIREVHMKKVLFALVVVAVVSAVVIIRVRSNSPLRDAQRAEELKKYNEALSDYITSLLNLTSSVSIPERSRARTVSTKEWDNEIRELVHQLSTPAETGKQDLRIALSGIGRCTSSVYQPNELVRYKTFPCSSTVFRDTWKEMFFPEDVPLPVEQKMYLEEIRDEGMSILTIGTKRSYTYQAHLIDPRLGVGARLTLYPESERSIPVRPGTYLFVAQSTVTFPSGQIWRSPYTASAIEIPDTCAMVSVDVITQVRRAD